MGGRGATKTGVEGGARLYKVSSSCFERADTPARFERTFSLLSRAALVTLRAFVSSFLGAIELKGRRSRVASEDEISSRSYHHGCSTLAPFLSFSLSLTSFSPQCLCGSLQRQKTRAILCDVTIHVKQLREPVCLPFIDYIAI